MAEKAVDAETDMAVESILSQEVDEATNDNHSEETVALGGAVSHGRQFASVEGVNGGGGGVPTPSTSPAETQHNGAETGLAVKWGEELLQRSRHLSEAAGDSDVEVMEPPRIPTPELVHLLDSSDPEEEQESGVAADGGHSDYVPVADQMEEEEEVEPAVVMGGHGDLWQDILNDRVRIPEAPRLISKSLVDDDYLLQSSDDTQPLLSQVVKKKRRKKRRDLDLLSGVKREKLDKGEEEAAALQLPGAVTNRRRPGRPRKVPLLPLPELPPLRQSDFLAPNQMVYRGKIIDASERPKKAPVPKAPLSYTHITATITGLKKAATLAVVKEENSLHACDQCPRVYVKHRSLKIHKQRSHNSRLATACPECGKLLSAQHALKKHMLSHM